MITPLLTFIGIVSIGVVLALIPFIVDAYDYYRGAHYVMCPESKEVAKLEVDARRAAITSALGRTQLRVRECSRWPSERKHCNQACLSEMAMMSPGRRAIGQATAARTARG